MNKRYVKTLEKSVSEIGFGAWQLGSNGGIWEAMSEEYAIKLVKEAVHQGVTFFDTAPGYADGNSERILGIALKDLRKQVHINTKVGHGPNGEYEFTKEKIKHSIQRSLTKLQTNYLDSVILHNPDRAILSGEHDLYSTLRELKQEGIIKSYGVSIDSLEELEIVLKQTDVEVIEIMFNMIHQEPRYLFHQVKEKGILLIVKIPFDSGWLTGRFDQNTNFEGIRSRWDQETKDIRSEIVDQISQIVGRDNLHQKALQFILKYDAVSTIIPGTRTLEHLYSNTSASDSTMSNHHKTQIETLYETVIKHKKTPW